MSFQTQQEGRRESSQEAADAYVQVSVSTVSMGAGVKPRHPRDSRLLPTFCHHLRQYPRQEYTVLRFFVFVFKQGLIKLHGIEKKEMYQRIQPETRLHIGVAGGINAKWGREYCNQKQCQNKSYNKLFFKKRETDRHAKMDAHVHTHALHTRHSSLVFSVDEGSRAGHHGKKQQLDMRREGSAPLPPVE